MSWRRALYLFVSCQASSNGAPITMARSGSTTCVPLSYSVHLIPLSFHLRPCSAILHHGSRKRTSNSRPFHFVLPTLVRQLGRHFQLLRTGAHHPFHSPCHISLEMLTNSCRRVCTKPKPSFPCLQSFLLREPYFFKKIMRTLPGCILKRVRT